MSRLHRSVGEVHFEDAGRLYIGASATADAFARVIAEASACGLPVRILTDREAVNTLELMLTLSVYARTADLTARFELLGHEPHAVDMFCTSSTELAGSHGALVVRSGRAVEPAPTIPVVGAGSPNNSMEVDA